MVIRIIVDILQLYIAILFIRIVLSWFPTSPWSKLGRANRALGAVTDPVLVPVRRVLPPMRFGGAGIDLSPLVVFLGLEIIIVILNNR